MTARNGRVQKLENVFLRGGHIKFIVLPDLLKNAPMFKKIQSMKRAQPDTGKGGGKRPTNKKQKTKDVNSVPSHVR
jgi:small nuclear ribonucleoprotein D3